MSTPSDTAYNQLMAAQFAGSGADETVTIPKKKYNQLVKDQRVLYRLEAAGVDNWEGYSEAFSDDYEDVDDIC